MKIFFMIVNKMISNYLLIDMLIYQYNRLCSMNYICSTCGKKCAHLCSCPGCPNPFVCNLCVNNTFYHQHQKSTIKIDDALIYSNQTYFDEVRSLFKDLNIRMMRMVDDHLNDLRSITSSTLQNRSLQTIRKLRSIKQVDQLTTDDFWMLKEDINSKKRFKNMNVIVGCLKDNFKNCYDRIDNAIKALITTNKFNQNKADFQLKKAINYQENNVKQLALRTLKNSRDYNPENAECHYRLGFIEQKLNQKQKSYRRCLQIQPNHTRSLNNLGCILIENKEFSQAISMFKRVVQIGGNHHKLFFNLGKCYQSLGDTTQAENQYRRAYQMDKCEQYRKSLDNIRMINRDLQHQIRMSQLSL